MLRRLGWSEEAHTGGLGRDGQGRRFPVATIFKQDRSGLGLSKTARPRVTHFAPKDVAAVVNRRITLRGACDSGCSRLDRVRLAKTQQKDREKERRFRQEFQLDDEKLRILYGEKGFGM